MALGYGPIHNIGGKVDDYVFAASETFREDGGAFVNINTSGLVQAAVAADATIFGYALLGFSPGAPRVDETGTYGQRVLTTVAGDSWRVYLADGSTVFKVPADDTYAKATHLGIDCDLVVTSNKQMADIGTSSTNVLRIVQGSGTDVEVVVNTVQIAQLS